MPFFQTYIKSFFASFFCFALQFFAVKISQFYFNENQLTLLFAIFAFGFSTGAVTFHVLKKKADVDFLFVTLAIALFLTTLHYTDSRYLFYLVTFFLSLPSGYIISSGLSSTSAHRFYFSDLLGGGVGIIYGLFSTHVISVETSLVTFGLVAALLALVGALLARRRRLCAFIIVLVMAALTVLQFERDTFNLISWSQNMSEPPPREDDPYRNGFEVLKNKKGQLLLTRWSPVDRIDILKKDDGGMVAYANNTAWTEIATEHSSDNYPYLRDTQLYHKVLSIGAGGGDDFVTAKRLGAKIIKGVEINAALVSLLKNELSIYNASFLKNIDLVAEDAHFYLKSTERKYDLIINKFTDSRSKSERYFTHYNLLRTSDSMELAMERLTEKGIGLWTFRLRDTRINATLLDLLLAAHSFLGKQGVEDIRRHFVVLHKKSTKVYHVLFSVVPIDNEFMVKTFWSHKDFDFVFPGEKSNDRLYLLFDGLRPVKERIKLIRYLEKFNSETFFPLTQSSPVEGSTTNAWVIAINLILCAFGMIGLFAYLILFRYRRSEGGVYRRTALAFHIIPLLSGFAYGLLQTAFIQEIEYYTSTVTYYYGMVLCMFLISGSVASFISDKVTSKQAIYSYGLLPLASLFWYSDQNHSNFFWIFCGAGLFLYFVSISLLFPKVLSYLRRTCPEEIPFVLANNLLAMASGSSVFCLFFVIYDRYRVLSLVLTVTVGVTALVALCGWTIQPKKT